MSKAGKLKRQLAKQAKVTQLDQQRELLVEQRRTLVQLKASRFQGPIPPPNMLAEYEGVFPGCAERIVAMAERQAIHRQGIEARVVDGNVRAQAFGQYAAFGLSTILLVGGVWLTSIGLSIAGLSILAGDAVAIIGAFVYGKISQKRERVEKAREIDGESNAEPAPPAIEHSPN